MSANRPTPPNPDDVRLAEALSAVSDREVWHAARRALLEGLDNLETLARKYAGETVGLQTVGLKISLRLATQYGVLREQIMDLQCPHAAPPRQVPGQTALDDHLGGDDD